MVFRITMHRSDGQKLEAVCTRSREEAFNIAREVVANGDCLTAQVWDAAGTLLHEETGTPE